MLNSQWYYQAAQLVYGPVPAVTVLQLVKDRILSFEAPVKMVSAPGNPEGGWVPLNRTFLMEIYYGGGWQTNNGDVFQSIKNAINNITGDTGKLNISFSQLFSDVTKKHSTAEADQLFISGTSLTTPPESAISTGWPKPWLFSRIFLALAGSFAILLICCLIFGTESAANVIPGMIFMGSLAIPFSVLVFFWEINVPRNISFFEITKIFFLGGTLSLLLTFFLHQLLPVGELNYGGAIIVGIVEETAKFLAVLFFIRNAKIKYTLNGLLIGAAAGAGFAVFETAGYALFRSSTLNDILDILILRGVLSIGGHVVWTAIAGAAIVMVKKAEPLSSRHIFSGNFLKLYIVPVILHAIWDMPISFGSNIYLVNILLTIAVWVFIVKVINSGLKQIENLNRVQDVSQQMYG